MREADSLRAAAGEPRSQGHAGCTLSSVMLAMKTRVPWLNERAREQAFLTARDDTRQERGFRPRACWRKAPAASDKHVVRLP